MNVLHFIGATRAAEGQVEQIARTFGVDWPHLIAQIISFGIVCAVLYKFAYQRVLAMLEERRQQIAQGLANAEKIKAELDKTEAQRQEVMAQANAQASKFIEEARPRPPACRSRKRRRPSPPPNRSWSRRAKPPPGSRRMLAELKREVGRLVVQATATVTGKILTPEDQRAWPRRPREQVAA